MGHPLEGYAFRFHYFKGFQNNPGDWLIFDQINVLVGRNNSGKSAIIDALQWVLNGGKDFRSDHRNQHGSSKIEMSSPLSERQLREIFPENTSGGSVPGGNHWNFGQLLVGSQLLRSYDEKWNPNWIEGPDLAAITEGARAGYRENIVRSASIPNVSVITVAAERNVIPEVENETKGVEPNGVGLTNLIRAFLYDARLPMSEVERNLLRDLNTIYKGDVVFERIVCRRDPSSNWEIHLQEKDGDAIRLSQSGSSLKSIFIILATIRLNQVLESKKSVDWSVLCIEEPENNLHPALLQRLLDFLCYSAKKAEATLIITTHSSVAIDWAARRNDSRIYHVRRDSEGSSVALAKEYRKLRELIADLDIRASEILQANGIIWVEGPSDRIYIKKWLSLISEGAFSEGVHYSIMYYGGRLLNHLSSLPPDEVGQAISLLRLNRNSSIVIDSDIRSPKSEDLRSQLSHTKKRLIQECEAIGGTAWVTEGKEIENYVSPTLLSSISAGAVNNVDQYESVPDRVSQWARDKIALAHSVAEASVDADLDVLNLRPMLEALASDIRIWNAM